MSRTVARVPAPPAVEHAEGDVAGAAGDIEQRERRGSPAWRRRIDRGDQRVLPGAVQPARHQVVHQVVAARDRCGTRRRPAPACRRAALGGSRNGCRLPACAIGIVLFRQDHSAMRAGDAMSAVRTRHDRVRHLKPAEFVRARSSMPELPEVETVRRGLEPAMEGARFTKVEARRGDLRWPLPKDFAARLEGKTVSGLGRRAKYLLADLSSGEVLLMHLGMSGSFRVRRGEERADARRVSITNARSTSRTTTSCSTCRNGATRHLQRSAPLRLHEARAARRARRRSRCCARSAPSRSATRSTPPCWRTPAPARRPA